MRKREKGAFVKKNKKNKHAIARREKHVPTAHVWAIVVWVARFFNLVLQEYIVGVGRASQKSKTQYKKDAKYKVLYKKEENKI